MWKRYMNVTVIWTSFKNQMNFIWKKFIWRLFESYIQRRYSYNNIIIISITKQLITNTTYYQKLQYHDYLVKFKQFSLLIKKNFTMIFLFRNLITQFSYSISRLFMKMEHCVGSLFDEEHANFSTLVSFILEWLS